MASSATEHREAAAQVKRRHYDYGGNPLAHVLSNTGSVRLPAFAGDLQPGLYRPPPFKFANPVPLENPALVIAPALAYGGFIQLLAGMWDISMGNVFGGTALSSYGGFWISLAIILTPGGFDISDAYSTADFNTVFGLYIFGWMVYTFLLWLCTLKSTVFFSALFALVWISFLCLGIANLDAQNNPDGKPNVPLTRAGGGFGIVAGFVAWYIMLAGIADPTNSFFLIPVIHFPWSEKGREGRRASKVQDNSDSV
ncbi:hypothetical protein LTR85_002667 [Meristemomyces frigidus]|nr:hypothetical protein LTR85_002667 [Meristemomyces frigidus]